VQTAFNYNGILVKDVVTEVIDFSSEKEGTGVDQIGITLQCVLSGVVHAKQKGNKSSLDSGSLVDSTGHTGLMIDQFQTQLFGVLKALSKDRRRFTLSIGGNNVIDIWPGASEITIAGDPVRNVDVHDVSNGPQVRVQVVKIVGGVAAHIRFTLTATIPNCGSTQNASQLSLDGLRNFRFWINEYVDGRTFLTTRSFIGRLRVAHKNISPHALARLITVPPLEPGFQRQVVRWDESSDGLHLDFTIQDQERIASAPWSQFAQVGAVDWDGHLTCSTNSFGYTGTIDFQLRLTGPKSTSKSQLIELAYLVADSKARLFEAFQAAESPDNSVVVLETLQVTEHLANNIIEIAARIRHTGSQVDDRVLSMGPNQILGKPLGDLGINYDPQKHFAPALTAGVGNIFLSSLNTPCAPAQMPSAVPQKKIPRYKTKDGAGQDDGEESDADAGESSGSSNSPSQLQFMYLEYLINSDIIFKSGSIALFNGSASGSQLSPISVVNLHRQGALREVRIDATRLNAQPELPKWLTPFPDRIGNVHTPVDDARVSAILPQVSADNRKLIYRVEMDQMFALAAMPQLNQNLPIGCVPYRTVGAYDLSRTIPGGAFVDPASLLS
jgi:hypothetical protein